MKKRKTYEISIIDKTYSKIISDETKFYTSDTALELVFKLKETEYTFESAEIVLLNIDDRSLVTRPVTKTSDSFVYEIEEDITAHYGDWRGQLRFEQGGETYVSSPVKFRIENDLENDRSPQLSDVQSWVSLKRYADSLTEELKQAVLSVEGIEDTFNENELARQSQFETAEQSRQTTFENNETGRFETFNTNEATRQENETTRQQAETQRASAESSRASAEEQRKIDHANRSAELAGKADKVVLKNDITNGDFSEGTNMWVGYYSIITAENNVLTISSLGNVNSPYIFQQVDVEEDDVVYGMAKVKPSDGIQSIYFLFDGLTHSNINNPTLDVYHPISFVHKKGIGNMNYIIRVLLNSLVSGIKVEIKDVGLINLTKVFGVGNEPTKEEMDELIKVTGYIDGEYALNNKEMLIWTLALIRRNKNSIVALGGA